MQKRFLVLSKVGQELDDILQVAFGLDGVIYVIAAALAGIIVKELEARKS